MPYIVSGTIAGAPKPVGFRFDEVGRALTQARILLKSGASDVSIHDERGHHIEGPALAAAAKPAVYAATFSRGEFPARRQSPSRFRRQSREIDPARRWPP